jgi:hypothetical protein
MVEPSQDEKIEMQGCTAAAMHLAATNKFGKVSASIIIVAIIVSILKESFWPMAIGIFISFFVSYFIRYSCFRYLERTTGMPRDVQSYFLLRYKSDKGFATKVDAMQKGASSTARNLR